MSHTQPPPPPAGGPARNGPFDPKSVNPLDWSILGISFLIFIFSFMNYVAAGPFGINAWHWSDWTFLTWFAMALGVLAGAAVAAQLFAPQVRLPMSNRVLSLGLYAGSFVLYFLAIFVHMNFAGIAGHAFAFWISLILAAGGIVVSLMRVQQTGERLPGKLANLPDISNLGQRNS